MLFLVMTRKLNKANLLRMDFLQQPRDLRMDR
ncbi:hypothetical protein GLYMA_10G133551v4 [Glycine max]|nr:hypothetical protein GLYMA_10G133551v4 [Glycine max]KAH1138054.1 hypothetical protein GYH30_027885 [Glycine max]